MSSTRRSEEKIFGLTEMRSSMERVHSVSSDVFSGPKKKLRFGIKFLDKALNGILSGDLMLIGARTGAGKTELVTAIARNVASAGHNVVMFALEADRDEIERRALYSTAARLYYADTKREYFDIDYPLFALGEHDKRFNRYIENAAVEVARKLRTMKTYYRDHSGFSITHFEQALNHIHQDTQLVIIDHLHYFDTETENENREMAAIVKKLRDMALVTRIPIILVAHLRKRDKRVPEIMPSIDDFHGTSNIVKVCTKALLIEPCFDSEHKDSTTWQTYMRVGKYRLCGARTRYVGKTYFDIRTNSYRDEFVLGFLKNNETEFSPIDQREFPAWAKDEVKIDVPKNYYDRNVDF